MTGNYQVVANISADSKKKGGHGGGILYVLWSTTPLTSPSSGFMSVLFHPFWIGERASLTVGLSLVCLRGTIFSLGALPPLFHNVICFNIKAAIAHHPVIQKDVDQIFCQSAIEPSTRCWCLL